MRLSSQFTLEYPALYSIKSTVLFRIGEERGRQKMKHTQRAPIVSVMWGALNSSQSTSNHTRVLLGRERNSEDIGREGERCCSGRERVVAFRGGGNEAAHSASGLGR